MIKKFISTVILGLALNSAAHAETFLGMSLIDSQPLNEIWLDSGFVSYHFNRDKELNENNYGLGGEYKFSTVNAITAGRFYNSDYRYSNYIGLYYQPFALGPFRLGAVIGGFNGYPNTREGGWFLAAIPMATAEWGRFGANITVVPSIGNKLYGAISLQFKIKIWD